MPRRGPVQKRPVINDPVCGSPLISQLIDKVLLNGKESTAERIAYGASELCEEKTGTDPVLTLKCAIENVKPALEVCPYHVGGAAYQVPIEIHPGCGTTLALRWLLMFSRQYCENTMTERLANEILDISSGLGASVKCRKGTYKMAEANCAFAHYRW